MRFFNILCFALLCVACGCRPTGPVTQQDFTIRAPENAKPILGEDPMWALEEWKRCGNKYYIGYSIKNMDERKVKICKRIENDNMMCVYYLPYQLEDGGGNKIPWVAVFNIEYNSQGIIYSCTAERQIGFYY